MKIERSGEAKHLFQIFNETLCGLVRESFLCSIILAVNYVCVIIVLVA